MHLRSSASPKFPSAAGTTVATVSVATADSSICAFGWIFVGIEHEGSGKASQTQEEM
jgi:hypothetical protein